jgi:hypothetical protein
MAFAKRIPPFDFPIYGDLVLIFLWRRIREKAGQHLTSSIKKSKIENQNRPQIPFSQRPFSRLRVSLVAAEKIGAIPGTLFRVS